MNTPKATIDFETRSACSLKKSGAWKYSLDPTTEVLCMVYRLPYWKPERTQLWIPGVAHQDLDAWIQAGELLEAHNAFFERAIWTNILVPRYGFPPIDASQWRCSAAKAASHALPRALEDAIYALNEKKEPTVRPEKISYKIGEDDDIPF